MTKISFVGVAHIHVPGFVSMLKKHTDVQVAAVWDADPARRSHWAKATGAREVDSAEEAIAAADAVVITSQTDGHAPLVAAVAKSKKHVFVEKPLGMAHADAAEMAAAIEATGVIFQTGYFMRSEAPVQAIKKLIDSGALGQITKATASNAHSGAIGDWFKKKPDARAEDWNWMTDVKQSGVGAFGDLGTHVLDILISWFGDVTRVTAQIDNVTNTYGCDESGQGLIRLQERRDRNPYRRLGRRGRPRAVPRQRHQGLGDGQQRQTVRDEGRQVRPDHPAHRPAAGRPARVRTVPRRHHRQKAGRAASDRARGGVPLDCHGGDVRRCEEREVGDAGLIAPHPDSLPLATTGEGT